MAASLGTEEDLISGVQKGVAGCHQGDGQKAVLTGPVEGRASVGGEETIEDLLATRWGLADFEDRRQGLTQGEGKGSIEVQLAQNQGVRWKLCSGRKEDGAVSLVDEGGGPARGILAGGGVGEHLDFGAVERAAEVCDRRMIPPGGGYGEARSQGGIEKTTVPIAGIFGIGVAEGQCTESAGQFFGVSGPSIGPGIVAADGGIGKDRSGEAAEGFGKRSEESGSGLEMENQAAAKLSMGLVPINAGI